MTRKQILHITFLLLLIVGWAWLEQSTTNTNWEQTFYSSHKAPYGTYVVKDNLESLFPNVEVDVNRNSFYKLMDGSDSTSTNACMIIISKDFKVDSLSLSKMNEFIGRGNSVFISAQHFSPEILLEYEITLKHAALNISKQLSKLRINTEIKDTIAYDFKKMGQSNFFEVSKNTTIKVLGKENQKPCFLEISKGDGKLFVHTQPLAFTNYHILYNHHEYTSRVLSYVLQESDKIIWDNYHNPFFSNSNTPLKIILSKPALRSGLYFALIILLIYVLFFAKRKQQIIPILQPPVNLSLGFIDTIGRLYFQNSNHKDIVEKQFIQLNHFIKKKYFITRIEYNNDFFESLSLKSGIDKSIISDIYLNYNKLKQKETIAEHELHIFTNQIGRFHKNIKRK